MGRLGGWLGEKTEDIGNFVGENPATTVGVVAGDPTAAAIGTAIDNGGGGSPNAPASPDYNTAAQQQYQANLEAAIAGHNLSNPNIVNPYGTVTYTDPTTPGGRPTMTQTLSPEQQALYEKQVQMQGLLGDLGIQGTNYLQGAVGKDLDLSGATPMPGSAADTRERVYQAMMARANQDFNKQREDTESNLYARGMAPGSKGYTQRMDQVDRMINDYRNQAYLAGGTEAQRDYNMDMGRRQQSLSEILAKRQIPFNEVMSLKTGAQVSNPFSLPGYSGSQVAPAPIFGAAQAQGAWDQNIYNQQVGTHNQMLEGMFGLGQAGASAAGGRR